MCLSLSKCCHGSNKNLHRRNSFRTSSSGNNLTGNFADNSQIKGSNGCSCVGSICLKPQGCICEKGCSWFCIPRHAASCGSIILTLSCCCFGIRKKSIFDRNGGISERREQKLVFHIICVINSKIILNCTYKK